ncbi:MAG: hypothetical protein ABEL76_04325, partial [Bradymonadaceae bacterium]
MELTYLEVDHELDQWGRLTDEQRETFVDRLLPYWLYHEHALEGIPLSPEAIRRSLEDKPCRNYCDAEVKRSLQLLAETIRQVYRRARDAPGIDAQWVRQLHRRLHVGEQLDDEERSRDRDTSPGVYNLDIVPSDALPEAFEEFAADYDDEFGAEHP